MWDGIEGLGEVQYDHVYLCSTIELPKEVMDGREELSFTGVARSEAMVQLSEDLVAFKMFQDMFADNVLQDLTGDAG